MISWVLGKCSPTETDPWPSLYSFLSLFREVLGSQQKLAGDTEGSHRFPRPAHTQCPPLWVPLETGVIPMVDERPRMQQCYPKPSAHPSVTSASHVLRVWTKACVWLLKYHAEVSLPGTSVVCLSFPGHHRSFYCHIMVLLFSGYHIVENDIYLLFIKECFIDAKHITSCKYPTTHRNMKFMGHLLEIGQKDQTTYLLWPDRTRTISHTSATTELAEPISECVSQNMLSRDWQDEA